MPKHRYAINYAVMDGQDTVAWAACSPSPVGGLDSLPTPHNPYTHA